MGSPSLAECETMIKHAVAVFDKLLNCASIDSPNVIGLMDTFEQAIEGDYAAQALGGMRAIRGDLASAISADRVRAVLDPIWVDLAKAQDYAEKNSGVEAIIRRHYRYMIENSKSVNARDFTFGTPTFSGATGNGAIKRLALDEDSQDIEIGVAESFEARCVADQGSVDRHKEVFRFSSGDAPVDGLERYGSGSSRDIACRSADDSLVLNPHFALGTSGVSITNWDVATGDVVNTAIDTANYPKTYPGQSMASLKIQTANLALSQKISNTGAKLAPNVPWYLQLMFNRAVGSGSGTLAIALGATTASVAVAAQTGWNVLGLAMDQGLWWKNFKENDLDITITWTHTSGYVLVADVILVPLEPFRGQWYIPIGGTTPFMLRDRAAWSDSLVESKLQYWIQYAYPGIYLPSDAGGSETWTDPS